MGLDQGWSRNFKQNLFPSENGVYRSTVFQFGSGSTGLSSLLSVVPGSCSSWSDYAIGCGHWLEYISHDMPQSDSYVGAIVAFHGTPTTMGRQTLLFYMAVTPLTPGE